MHIVKCQTQRGFPKFGTLMAPPLHLVLHFAVFLEVVKSGFSALRMVDVSESLFILSGTCDEQL